MYELSTTEVKGTGFDNVSETNMTPFPESSCELIMGMKFLCVKNESQLVLETMRIIG